MEGIRRHIEAWQHKLNVQYTSDLFVRAMYLILLWSTVKLSAFGSVIWGTDHMHQLYDPYTNIDKFAMLLNNEAIRPFWWLIAGSMMVLLVAGILGWHNWASRAAVAYLFVLLHFGNVEISTGGHHLTQQLLFFHVLLFKVAPDKEGQVWWFLRFVHHVAFYSIWIQIGIMYLVAGYWKLLGTTWWDGTALLLTLSYKEFSFPWLAALATENNLFLAASSYVVFAYQVLFILLIWVKSIRPYFLTVGLVFHLSIAFVVGITDFGLLMVAGYAVFVEPNTAKRLLGLSSGILRFKKA